MAFTLSGAASSGITVFVLQNCKPWRGTDRVQPVPGPASSAKAAACRNERQAGVSPGSWSCPAGGVGLDDATGRGCELYRKVRLHRIRFVLRRCSGLGREICCARQLGIDRTR